MSPYVSPIGDCRIGDRISECLKLAQAAKSLPAKYDEKLLALQRVSSQYRAQRTGYHTAEVSYVSKDGTIVSHVVNLELVSTSAGSPGTPQWLLLCSCGKPWVRRYPCIHVVIACQALRVRV